MDYPLGSFPRFGHQERWARERRQRAIENSIITRRWNAYWRRQRNAHPISQIQDYDRASDINEAKDRLLRLGLAARDWFAFIRRTNHKVGVDASIAVQLSAECAAIHEEFERMLAEFSAISEPSGSRGWARDIERLDARYGHLGARGDDFKRRLSEARIGPISLRWLRLRAFIGRDCGSDERTRPNQ